MTWLFRYVQTVLLAIDQLVNALTGGYADETISYRLAVYNAEGKWFGCWFCRVAQWLVFDHCSLTKPGKGSRLSRHGALKPDARGHQG